MRQGGKRNRGAREGVDHPQEGRRGGAAQQGERQLRRLPRPVARRQPGVDRVRREGRVKVQLVAVGARHADGPAARAGGRREQRAARAVAVQQPPVDRGRRAAPDMPLMRYCLIPLLLDFHDVLLEL